MTLSQRVSNYRARMRARGFRPVQMWVPDMHSEALVREARRQSVLVAEMDRRADDQDFIEAVSVDWRDE
ncbi:antitoxin MazE family protein [Corynebacterium hindlerae]|uniref:Antitoxin MazE family protein n=1 Tax=Corynebacterium hindlerae TaxID=699041 RepID=A0A7G5FGY9_9CORY|nr:antitoxin MazE family protein [Corynebacterium hindlerae]QMV85880.1 antitoxin MazE family protein [Corynebacterium hindlerae]